MHVETECERQSHFTGPARKGPAQSWERENLFIKTEIHPPILPNTTVLRYQISNTQILGGKHPNHDKHVPCPFSVRLGKFCLSIFITGIIDQRRSEMGACGKFFSQHSPTGREPRFLLPLRSGHKETEKNVTEDPKCCLISFYFLLGITSFWFCLASNSQTLPLGFLSLRPSLHDAVSFTVHYSFLGRECCAHKN